MQALLLLLILLLLLLLLLLLAERCGLLEFGLVVALEQKMAVLEGSSGLPGPVEYFVTGLLPAAVLVLLGGSLGFSSLVAAGEPTLAAAEATGATVAEWLVMSPLRPTEAAVLFFVEAESERVDCIVSFSTFCLQAATFSSSCRSVLLLSKL